MEKVACVAAILFNPRGQVLLQQRDQAPGLSYPGHWTLWGGRVEAGETPEEAMRRELEEELELVGVPLTWWQMVERPWRDGIVIEQHVFVAPFDRAAADLTLHEGQSLGFFDREALITLPIAFIFRELLETFFATRGSRDIWDDRYQRHPAGSDLVCQPWLEAWLPHIWRAVEQTGARQILDLGCGRGDDSRYLAGIGFDLTAADFSFQALRQVGRVSGLTERIQLDLRQGLPFAPRAFAVVVANLSLHYFSWAQTIAILETVRGCLGPGGLLLARFNSTNDVNHGAGGPSGSPEPRLNGAGGPAGPPEPRLNGAGSGTEIEPHAFWVGGMYKRFFDRPDLERLFADGWQVVKMEEETIIRYQYGEPKVAWTVAAYTVKTYTPVL